MALKTTVALLFVGLVASTCTSGGEGDDGPVRDSAALRDALASASSGETVMLAPGSFEGPFTVPADVSLIGAETGESIIEAETDGVALRLTPGTEETNVSRLTVRTDGAVGILAMGTGAVRLHNVSIVAERGVAIAAEDLTSLVLGTVEVTGPIDASNVDALPAVADPAETATHGVLLVRVADAQITGLTVTGFAEMGLAAVESNLTWEGGDGSANRGTGVIIHGGTAEITDVRICDTLKGAMRLLPSYAGVFAAEASVETSGLEVCDGESYGLLQDAASVVHENLSAHGNGAAALWTQNSPSFEISGTETLITDNGMAGVVSIDNEVVTIVDAQIDSSRWVARIFGEVGTIEVADGIQITGPKGPTLVDGVSLTGNERIGLLITTEDDDLTPTVTDLSVTGSGDQFGAVFQDRRVGGLSLGWDESVERLGATDANDLTNPSLDTVPAETSEPASGVADLDRDGIAGVIGDPGAF